MLRRPSDGSSHLHAEATSDTSAAAAAQAGERDHVRDAGRRLTATVGVAARRTVYSITGDVVGIASTAAIVVGTAAAALARVVG